MSMPAALPTAAPQCPPLPDYILRLLAYSWVPVEFQYGYLTDKEKECVNEAEFDATVPHIRSYLRANPDFAAFLGYIDEEV